MRAMLQRCQNLTSLDLSGCAGLNSSLILNSILPSRANMLHLNLTGSCSLNWIVVHAVSDTWQELETLTVGGCSQSIDDGYFGKVGEDLGWVQAFDLLGLKRITDKYLQLFFLPKSLECLDLSRCKRVNLYPLDTLAF